MLSTQKAARGVRFAGGEHAAAHVVPALPEPLHPLAVDAVVRRDAAARLVDDPRPRLEVVLDALADETVDAVVEEGTALGHRGAGLAVDLDTVGQQSGRSLGDLDVAGRNDEVVGGDLLEPIGEDRHVTARRGHGGGRPLPHGRWGTKRVTGHEQAGEDDRGGSHMLDQVCRKSSRKKGPYAISPLFDGARVIAPAAEVSEDFPHEEERAGNTNDGGAGVPHGHV